MIYVIFVITCAFIAAMVLYIAHSTSKNVDTAFDKVDTQQIIKEIEKLDDVTDGINSSKKIMVPDSVNIKESTLKSTQNDDCKQYTVENKKAIEKVVVGNKNYVEENTNQTSNSDDSEEDDPIKIL